MERASDEVVQHLREARRRCTPSHLSVTSAPPSQAYYEIILNARSHDMVPAFRPHALLLPYILHSRTTQRQYWVNEINGRGGLQDEEQGREASHDQGSHCSSDTIRPTGG